MKENLDFINLNIDLNVKSEDEHEPYIEKFNRILIERCRMCFDTLPLKKIPRQMAIKLVYLQIFLINFVYLKTTSITILALVQLFVDENMIIIFLCGQASQFGEYT